MAHRIISCHRASRMVTLLGNNMGDVRLKAQGERAF